VVELDWDRVRAVDLMKLFSSFTPKGSTVVSVKVLPSEFGKERMKQEDLSGPPKEIFKKHEENSEGQEKRPKKGKKGKKGEQEEKEEKRGDDLVLEHLLHETDDNDEFDPQALRRYQLDRLK